MGWAGSWFIVSIWKTLKYVTNRPIKWPSFLLQKFITNKHDVTISTVVFARAIVHIIPIHMYVYIIPWIAWLIDWLIDPADWIIAVCLGKYWNVLIVWNKVKTWPSICNGGDKTKVLSASKMSGIHFARIESIWGCVYGYPLGTSRSKLIFQSRTYRFIKIEFFKVTLAPYIFAYQIQLDFNGYTCRPHVSNYFHLLVLLLFFCLFVSVAFFCCFFSSCFA